MNTEQWRVRCLHAVGNTPALCSGGASTDLDTSNLSCELAKGRQEELTHYEITLWARTMPAEDRSTSRVPGSLVQGFRPSLLHHRIRKTTTNVKRGCDGHGFAGHVSLTHTQRNTSRTMVLSYLQLVLHVRQSTHARAPRMHSSLLPWHSHAWAFQMPAINYVQLC